MPPLPPVTGPSLTAPPPSPPLPPVVVIVGVGAGFLGGTISTPCSFRPATGVKICSELSTTTAAQRHQKAAARNFVVYEVRSAETSRSEAAYEAADNSQTSNTALTTRLSSSARDRDRHQAQAGLDAERRCCLQLVLRTRGC